MSTWKNDNENNGTGNIMLIKSEELDHKPTTTTAEAEIKITFRRPRQRQSNGCTVNLRKLLQLKHQSNQ
jgi:hypothetical protein